MQSSATPRRVLCHMIACAVLMLMANLGDVAHSRVSADDAPLISEGVHLIGADQWHAAGFTGKGVKIGVIDFELPDAEKYLPNVKLTTKSFKSSPNDPFSASYDFHYVTAFVEIIHEVAPDAEIYFAESDDGTSYPKALGWLIDEENITILADNNFWPSGVLDGSNIFDQYLHIVKQAGVFTSVSSLPEGSGLIGSTTARGHYGATFTDADGDGYHDFSAVSGVPGMNSLPVRVVDQEVIYRNAPPSMKPQAVFMNLFWNGDENSKMLYTLTIVDAQGKEVARAQPFGSRVQYLQSLSATLPTGDYTMRIKKTQPDEPDVPFDVFFSGMQATQVVPAGAFHVPQDSNDAVTVGPVNWQDDTIPPYVAHGPTQDGRTKPDLVAPDCVSTPVQADSTKASLYLPNDSLTCGIAASAHFAGAAALYKQAYPDATPDDILVYFQQHAKKLTGADGDPNTSGAGRLQLGPPPA